MDKKKRTLVLGDDGELLGDVFPTLEKPKRSIGPGFRRTGCIGIAIFLALILGVVIGVIGYSRYQTVAPNSQLAVGIQPTTTLWSTNIKQPSTPRGAISILWASDCDPRTDSRHCSQGDLDIFSEFYATIRNLGAVFFYTLPRSSDEMFAYDVVVLSYCDFAASDLPAKIFQDYVSGGGSLIVMGDNFCQGVHANGMWGSSAEAANLLTRSWGIGFTADDDANNPNLATFMEHPLTAGLKTIYLFRHAYLTVQAPATTIASINNRAVIAVYDSAGTVVAMPDTGFVWGSAFKNQIGSADNFKFWRNMFDWLSRQSRAKHT